MAHPQGDVGDASCTAPQVRASICCRFRSSEELPAEAFQPSQNRRQKLRDAGGLTQILTWALSYTAYISVCPCGCCWNAAAAPPAAYMGAPDACTVTGPCTR